MGNLVGVCVPIVPSEGEGQDGDAPGIEDEEGVGSKRPVFNSEFEGIHEPPTTITAVLSNAFYAMEFHKHLALT